MDLSQRDAGRGIAGGKDSIVAGEDQHGGVGEHEPYANGEQDLVLRQRVEHAIDQRPLQQGAQHEECRHGEDDRDERVHAGQLEEEEGDVHAHHHQVPLREVGDAHDAEDEREANAVERIDAPDEDAAEDRLHQDGHSQAPGLRLRAPSYNFARTSSASPMIRSVSSAAGSSRASAAAWPAQSESSPESPARAAAARMSLVSAFCAGKGASGAAAISRVKRLARPRAARPENARVTTVESSRACRSAARYGALVPASGQRRKAVPSCAAPAPSARAATTPRPSMMPPAAITGTRTASIICGTSAITPMSAGFASRSNVPWCPPASAPCAQMASTPASSSARASATVDAVPTVTMFAFLHASSIPRGGMPKVKLKTGTRSSSTTAKALANEVPAAGCGGARRSSSR